MARTYIALLACGLAAAPLACDRGATDCGPGFYPRNNVCVPFNDDAGDEPRGDGGVIDTGPAFPDASDAGMAVPIDASVFDSGVIIEAPAVTLGERGRVLITANAVLTMAAQNPIAPGEVYVVGSRIACVGARGACDAMSAGASVVETKGVLMPGLIDTHNHLAYDWMPEWESGRLWGDHQQWQGSSEYDVFIDPYRQNSGDRVKFCAMAQWGELRALVAGTTTMYGAIASRTCLNWLIRNAELTDNYNGFGEDRIRSNVLGIDTVDDMDAAAIRGDMDTGSIAAYFIHIAEGVSARAHDEYTELVRLGLLREETVIIHGTALTAADFGAVATAGAKLVWSPSSNMVLYGMTTDVAAAKSAGVSISIAPDWTPSGVDTILPELRFARAVAPAVFTERELFEAVTVKAAHAMAVDDIGTLEVGKYADLLVVEVDDANPYASAIEARSHHIRLVMIGGVPTYGDPAIVGAMRETPPSCHEMQVCGTVKRACWDDPADGPTSPETIAATITSFFPPGPFDLFRCD